MMPGRRIVGSALPMAMMLAIVVTSPRELRRRGGEQYPGLPPGEPLGAEHPGRYRSMTLRIRHETTLDEPWRVADRRDVW